jgi:hypothetical protein
MNAHARAGGLAAAFAEEKYLQHSGDFLGEDSRLSNYLRIFQAASGERS